MRAIKTALERTIGYEIKKYQSKQQRFFSHLLELRDTALIADPAIQNFLTLCARHIQDTKAQLFQDAFVLSVTGELKNGFFVEFGAMNGIAMSNSYLLETAYGWSGIVAEPARCWHPALQQNRKCSVDLRCVWSKSGEHLDFTEPQMAELATITRFSDWDLHVIAGKGGTRYTVQTVSLNDLLRHHGAPKTIDYLSIDTEGSELEILSAFDFSAHHVRIITVEHNHSPMRGKLHDLLTSNGFTRAFEEFSNWDDWYLKQGS
jgi:FkbM family methyltransferase